MPLNANGPVSLRRFLACLVGLTFTLGPAAPAEATHPFTSVWDASGGLLPDQVSPAWELTNSASPEDPILSGTELTLSTSSDSENMYYRQDAPLIVPPAVFIIEARMRFVSGTSSHISRAPAMITFATAPELGNGLFIDQDEIWINSANLIRGATAFVDTDDSFHTYRIEITGTAVEVMVDGVPTLSGSLFTSVLHNGSAAKVLFGDISSLAFGTSEWQSVSHNGVPERAPIILSADVGVDLAGTVVEDQQVAFDDGVGPVVTLAIGPLPVEAALSAYSRASNGDHLYSLETTVDLGSVVARPGDVVRYDGVSAVIEFDASAEGIPHAARVDALAIDGTDLLLSFDIAVELPGSVLAADEDLVRFDGLNFSLYFDGSSEGVSEVLDVDAADLRASDGVLLFSFDTTGSVGGATFDDEDVLAFDPIGSSWSLYYDGSFEHASLAVADVTAVPEPAWLLQLGAGFALLCALRIRRRRSAT